MNTTFKAICLAAKTYFTSGNFWKHAAFIMGGFILGMKWAIKHNKDSPEVTNVTAENYVKEQSQETKIGKIKQKGESNSQVTDIDPSQLLSKKEIRKARRSAKKAVKKAEKETVLSEGKENKEV